MRYVGFVSCDVYAPERMTTQEKSILPPNAANYYQVLNAFYRKYSKRIYSDEVQLCTGMLAFNRMEKVFKAKYPSKWEAWRAWRQLV